VPDAPIASAGCSEVTGKLAPFVDRNRCEGKADCVRVCPYDVCVDACPEHAIELRAPMSVGQQTSA
jgi:ferredoxin